MKKVTIIKFASLAASIIGMIGSAWASDKENKLALEKLVNQALNK